MDTKQVVKVTLIVGAVVVTAGLITYACITMRKNKKSEQIIEDAKIVIERAEEALKNEGK